MRLAEKPDDAVNGSAGAPSVEVVRIGTNERHHADW